MSSFFVYRSVTYAQKAGTILRANGIASHVLKAPSGLGGSCAYALRVNKSASERAYTVLERAGVRPERVLDEK